MGACTKVFALAHVMHFVVFLVGSAPSVEVASTNDRITCARKCTCSLWVKHDFAFVYKTRKRCYELSTANFRAGHHIATGKGSRITFHGRHEK